jgi:hypothetical protein
MLYLLGFLAVVILLGTLFLRWAVLIMGQRAGKFISETHHAIEFITNTRSVPPQWVEVFQKKAERLQQEDPHNRQKLDRLARAMRKVCLHKLDKLTKYIDNSSLVENEETRALLLTKFTEIHHEWMERDWNEELKCKSASPPSGFS